MKEIEKANLEIVILNKSSKGIFYTINISSHCHNYQDINLRGLYSTHCIFIVAH